MNRSNQNDRQASSHSIIDEREESLIEKVTNKVSDLIPKSLSGWLLKSRKRNLSACNDHDEAFENDVHNDSHRSSSAATTTAAAAEPANSCNESAHRATKRLKYSPGAADEIGNAAALNTHSNGGYTVAASRKTMATQTQNRASDSAAVAAVAKNSSQSRHRFADYADDFQQPQHQNMSPDRRNAMQTRSIFNRSTNEVLGRAKSPSIFTNLNGSSSYGDRSYGSNLFSPIRSRSTSTSRNSSVMRSPYYNDTIGYGGASSYSENHRNIPESEDNDSTTTMSTTTTSSLPANRKRVKITFDTSIHSPFSEKKVNSSHKSNLSNTAKKIFANLERYERSLKWADSTGELLKARHIEQTNSMANAATATGGVGSNSSGGSVNSTIATNTSINHYPYLKSNQVEVLKKSSLKVPTISQFLQMKLKQQLQNSTENLRKIATSESGGGGGSKTRKEVNSSQPNIEQYQLPKALSNSTENANAKFTLKIKNKITSRTRPPSTATIAAAAAAASYDKLTAQPLNLPSVPLPITKMPQFDLTGAKGPTDGASATPSDRSTALFASQSPPTFQFSMPKILGSGHSDEQPSPSAVVAASNDFKFNSPKPISGDFGAETAVMVAEGCAATARTQPSASLSSVASAAASLQKSSSKFVCKQCLRNCVFSPADICDSCKNQSKSSTISTAAIASNDAGKTKSFVCTVCGTEGKTASNTSNKCFRCQMAETNLKTKLLNNNASNRAVQDREIQSPILAIPKNKDVNANKIIDKNFFAKVSSMEDKSGASGAVAGKALASTSVYSLAPKPTKEEMKIFEELQPKSSANTAAPLFPLAAAKPTRSPAATAENTVPAFAPPAYSAPASSPTSNTMFSFGSSPITPTLAPATTPTATPTLSVAFSTANTASPSNAASVSASTTPVKSTFSPPKFTFGTNNTCSSTSENIKPNSPAASNNVSLTSDKTSQISFSLPTTTSTITSAIATTTTMTTSPINVMSIPSKGPPSYNATIAAAAAAPPKAGSENSTDKVTSTTTSFSFGKIAEDKNTATAGFSATAFGMSATSKNADQSQPPAFVFGKSDKSADAPAASSSATKTATSASAVTTTGFGKPLTISGEFSFAFPAVTQTATTSTPALTTTNTSTASTTSSMFGLGSSTIATTTTTANTSSQSAAATSFGFSFGNATSSPTTTAKTSAGTSNQGGFGTTGATGFGGFGSFSSFSTPASTTAAPATTIATPAIAATTATPTTTVTSSMFGSSAPSAFSGFGTGNKTVAAAATPASSPFSFGFQPATGSSTPSTSMPSSSSSLKPPALSSPLSSAPSNIFGTNKGTTSSTATTSATTASTPTFGALGSGSGLTSNGMFNFSGSATTASVFQNPASLTASSKPVFGSTPAATDNKFNFSFGGNASTNATTNPLSIGIDKTDSVIGAANSSASIFGTSAGAGSQTTSAATAKSQQQQQQQPLGSSSLFFGNSASSSSSAQPQQQQPMSSTSASPASQPASLFTFGSSAATNPSVSAGFNFNMSPPQSFVFPSSQQQPTTSSSFNNLPANTMFNFNATPTSSQLNSTGNVSGLAGNATNPAIQQRRRLIAARRTKPRQ